MSDPKIKIKENIRHVSIRKKQPQNLFGSGNLWIFFLNNDIDLLIKMYKENYLPQY